MKTIHKFPIKITDDQTVIMEVGAEILTVQMQRGEPFLWAIVDTGNELEDRNIEVIGTGHPIEGTNRKYIGTFQTHDGQLVFHVFEYLS